MTVLSGKPDDLFRASVGAGGLHVSKFAKRQPRCPFVLADDYLARARAAPIAEGLVVQLLGAEAIVTSRCFVRRINKPRRRAWLRSVCVAAVEDLPVANRINLRSDRPAHPRPPERARPNALAHPLRRAFA